MVMAEAGAGESEAGVPIPLKSAVAKLTSTSWASRVWPVKWENRTCEGNSKKLPPSPTPDFASENVEV